MVAAKLKIFGPNEYMNTTNYRDTIHRLTTPNSFNAIRFSFDCYSTIVMPFA